ncbi:hypothetical protein ACQ4PT_051622 [Festuca glaucescens]
MGQGKSSPSSAVEWLSLPEELLGMVRLKLASLRDRVRFAAVCSSWRAAASRQPPPSALPLLLLSPQDEEKEKRLYCLEDGGILRVPVPSNLCGMWLNGSYDGGWIIVAGFGIRGAFRDPGSIDLDRGSGTRVDRRDSSLGRDPVRAFSVPILAP